MRFIISKFIRKIELQPGLMEKHLSIHILESIYLLNVQWSYMQCLILNSTKKAIEMAKHVDTVSNQFAL